MAIIFSVVFETLCAQIIYLNFSLETDWCVQTVVELVYNIAQGILYTVPIYAMVGYDWKPVKFFYFLFFISASFLYLAVFGAMLIACSPSQLLASILVSFTITSWNIFAGFLIPRPVGIPFTWHYMTPFLMDAWFSVLTSP